MASLDVLDHQAGLDAELAHAGMPALSPRGVRSTGRPVAHLRQRGVLDDGKLAAIDERLRAGIEDAVQHAETTAPPPSETLVEGVYAEVPWHLREQYREMHDAIGR